MTHLAWLRRGATAATPEVLKTELAKLEILSGYGADRLDLSGLPAGRRRLLAETGSPLDEPGVVRGHENSTRTVYLRGLLGFGWYRSPMEAVIDSVGRVVLPKQLRDALGLTPGTKVDISAYGSGVQITPGGRTARLKREADGRLVSHADTVVTDVMMYALMDSGRR